MDDTVPPQATAVDLRLREQLSGQRLDGVAPHLALAVGDHPALHLVNSRALGGSVELLGDGEGLLDWLVAAGTIGQGDLDEVAGAWPAAEIDQAAESAVAVREWLRSALPAWVAGTDPVDAARILNPLLGSAPRRTVLDRRADGLHLGAARAFDTARSLLSLPTEAVADLLVNGDRDLVRPCEGTGCTLWFYDLTQSHRRRWCSMAVCGNRAKAAAHRRRSIDPLTRPH